MLRINHASTSANPKHQCCAGIHLGKHRVKGVLRIDECHCAARLLHLCHGVQRQGRLAAALCRGQTGGVGGSARVELSSASAWRVSPPFVQAEYSHAQAPEEQQRRHPGAAWSSSTNTRGLEQLNQNTWPSSHPAHRSPPLGPSGSRRPGPGPASERRWRWSPCSKGGAAEGGTTEAMQGRQGRGGGFESERGAGGGRLAFDHKRSPCSFKDQVHATTLGCCSLKGSPTQRRAATRRQPVLTSHTHPQPVPHRHSHFSVAVGAQLHDAVLAKPRVDLLQHAVQGARLQQHWIEKCAQEATVRLRAGESFSTLSRARACSTPRGRKPAASRHRCCLNSRHASRRRARVLLHTLVTPLLQQAAYPANHSHCQALRTLASVGASPPTTATSARAARAAAAAVTLLASRAPAWGCSRDDEKAVAGPSSRLRADRKAARSIGAPLPPPLPPPPLLRCLPARCGVARLAATLLRATTDIWRAGERRRVLPEPGRGARAGGCAKSTDAAVNRCATDTEPGGRSNSAIRAGSASALSL